MHTAQLAGQIGQTDRRGTTTGKLSPAFQNGAAAAVVAQFWDEDHRTTLTDGGSYHLNGRLSQRCAIRVGQGTKRGVSS
eukprot:3625858-Rhodomonas_salina.2